MKKYFNEVYYVLQLVGVFLILLIAAVIWQINA